MYWGASAEGMIILSVFAGFILAADSIVKSMGLVLTFGILFDAFTVRLTLIPAAIKLFGAVKICVFSKNC